MVSSYLKDLWAEIQKELDDKHPGWKGEIDLFYDHIDCVEENCLNEKEDFEERSEPHANCPPSAGRIARSRGSFRKMPGNAGLLSYRLIFKCFVFGLLSNSTEWSKVMSAIQKPVLSGHFCGYNPTLLQNVPDDYLMNIMYWFIGQGAASSYLRRGLFGLRATAHIFSEAISRCGFLSRYFDCVQGNDHDICLVCRFGTYGGRFKLPGFGIPLASESLKNAGYDIAKPDRHINRAMGCFGLVAFGKWPRSGGWSAPVSPTIRELREVMWVMDQFAKEAGVPVAFLDAAIWKLCAQSGPHLTNRALSRIAARCGSLPAKLEPIPCVSCIPNKNIAAFACVSSKPKGTNLQASIQ